MLNLSMFLSKTSGEILVWVSLAYAAESAGKFPEFDELPFFPVLVAVVFALGGWMAGQLHKAVLWNSVPIEDKAKIVQSAVISLLVGLPAFYVVSYVYGYPRMAGYLICSFASYGGTRVLDAVVDILIDNARNILSKIPMSKNKDGDNK